MRLLSLPARIVASHSRATLHECAVGLYARQSCLLTSVHLWQRNGSGFYGWGMLPACHTWPWSFQILFAAQPSGLSAACLLQGPALLSACHMLLKLTRCRSPSAQCVMSCQILCLQATAPGQLAQACNISGIDTLCCTAPLCIGQASCTDIICWPAGNSPWPIGVTSIGIHDRTSREKISHVMNGAAHVMNDEATRKYLQVSLTVGLRTGRSCGSC